MERLTIRHSPSSVTLNKLANDYEALLKLADYEDAEEQGLLLRLPCKVGSTLYLPIMDSQVQEIIVIGLCFDIVRNVWLYEIAFEYNNGEWTKTVCEFACIGKTVFLTREEAEAKLAEMQKG